jgi:hypothetical protein
MDTQNFEHGHSAAGAGYFGISGLAEWINLTHSLMQLESGAAAIPPDHRERLLELGLISHEDGAFQLTAQGRKAIGLRR